jgi:hypothetical protein
VAPAELHSAARPDCVGPAEVSPLLRVACAHVACCALPACILPLCASLVPCDTSSPTPTQRWPPTVPRRLRDADESDPHFRPRRLCSNVLRRARSDQDDQPAAGHAGARDGHCTLSSVTTLGPLCTKNCAPDKGIATPVHPYPVVPSVSRWPKTVSRNPVSHIPVYTVK